MNPNTLYFLKIKLSIDFYFNVIIKFEMCHITLFFITFKLLLPFKIILLSFCCDKTQEPTVTY